MAFPEVSWSHGEPHIFPELRMPSAQQVRLSLCFPLEVGGEPGRSLVAAHLDIPEALQPSVCDAPARGPVLSWQLGFPEPHSFGGTAIKKGMATLAFWRVFGLERDEVTQVSRGWPGRKSGHSHKPRGGVLGHRCAPT